MSKSRFPRRNRRCDRQLTARVARELYAELEAEAGEAGVTMSEVVRGVLIAHATDRITARARSAPPRQEAG